MICSGSFLAVVEKQTHVLAKINITYFCIPIITQRGIINTQTEEGIIPKTSVFLTSESRIVLTNGKGDDEKGFRLFLLRMRKEMMNNNNYHSSFGAGSDQSGLCSEAVLAVPGPVLRF